MRVDFGEMTERELIIHTAGRVEAIENRLDDMVVSFSAKQVSSIIIMVLGAFGVVTGLF